MGLGDGKAFFGLGHYLGPVFRIRIRIRIHRIHMFLGLMDPDPLVKGIRILLSLSKNSKKKPDFYSFANSFLLFIFEKWCKSTFKKYCSTTGKPTRSFATERVSLDSV